MNNNNNNNNNDNNNNNNNNNHHHHHLSKSCFCSAISVTDVSPRRLVRYLQSIHVFQEWFF